MTDNLLTGRFKRIEAAFAVRQRFGNTVRLAQAMNDAVAVVPRQKLAAVAVRMAILCPHMRIECFEPAPGTASGWAVRWQHVFGIRKGAAQ